MRFLKLLALFLAPCLCFAAQPDRIAGKIDGNQMVALSGHVHPSARAEFDHGRTDGGLMMRGLALEFHPSAAQQSALNKLLSQQQNVASPNFHKWLTPAQFADRFGMTRNDIDKVTAWLESEGLTVTGVSNSRNQVFFEGTTAQVEAALHTEIHNYLVEGELHYANATAPSVPASLSGSALAVRNLHNFKPKPHSVMHRQVSDQPHPNFTSVVSGNHFVAPGDFAAIYDVEGLYSAGFAGSGQKIALTGQSSINLTDVANFRAAAGLAAKAPTLLLMPSTGTSTRCPGDEGESDLDVEWSGGVAKNASITLVYPGLVGTDTCGNRTFGAFDALQYAIDQNVAPFISNSYGLCEVDATQSFAQSIRGWVQQGNSQGQTVITASGDSGAADCDYQVKSATQGLAVDIPGAIPEVTAMGGTEFTGDPAATVSGGNAGATSYWSGTTGGNDAISSALGHIPEMAWNDTAADIAGGGFISASGGGASTFFSKPAWQTGTGVPSGSSRYMPDLAFTASADHDGYLVCSEDSGGSALATSCVVGFRDSAGGTLTVVGGTSAAAPTFAGVAALINEYLVSNGLPSGLGNMNQQLYALSASNPTAFNDVTLGSNMVPCTTGTLNCPTSGTPQFGFNAGVGYDEVTGLGSVNANTLASAWLAASNAPRFALTTTSDLSPTSVPAGQSAGATITIAPVNGSTQTVTFGTSSCSGLPAGATCSFSPTSVTLDGTNSQTVTVTVTTPAYMAIPSGSIPITVSGAASGSGSTSQTTTINLTVTATNQSFTLTTTATTFPVAVGGSATVNVTVANPSSGGGSPAPFVGASTALPLTYTCASTPALSTLEIACQVSPGNGQPTSATGVTISLVTTAKTAQLAPFGKNRIFYAMLLPGLFGMFFAAGSRTRNARLLSLIVVLGFSTMWMGACGDGSSNNNTQPNPGTPAGSYAITINATTGGTNPLTASVPITLNVTQ